MATHVQKGAARLAAVLSSIALLAVACTGGSASETTDEGDVVTVPTITTTEADLAPAATASSRPSTTESTASPTPAPESTVEFTLLDDEFLVAIADGLSVTDGAVLLASFDADGVSATASVGTDDAGNSPMVTNPFRIASVTKVVTAVATLMLVDEGLVALDTPANEYVSRVAVPADVTVRHLLQHTSGLFPIREVPEAATLVDDPSRVLTPEDVMAFVVDRPPLFEAGSDFGYSNTSYIILGVLLEEVTGQSYPDVVRKRISKPLGLSASTYIAGLEEGPEPFDGFVQLDGSDYDYTALATYVWSAGGIVSSAADLHLFLTALFDDRLVSSQLVEEMIEGNEYGYGLGLQLTDATNGLYGHRGNYYGGYRTEVRHSPELGVTAFVTSTDTTIDPFFPMAEMVQGLRGVSASE